MLTVKELQAIKIGGWATDGPAGPGKGSGVLAFRRVSSGALLAYFRFTRSDSTRGAYPIGQMAERGRAGLSLTEARNKAGELAQLYLSGVKDIDTYFEEAERKAIEAEESSQKAREAEQKAIEAAKEIEQREALEREQYTLRKLCEVYTGFLQDQGKISTKSAESVFKCHVYPIKEISTLLAREISSDHIALLIRKVQEQGKARLAGILRSYLLATFNAATKAKYDATLPHVFVEFGVTSNPVTIIPAKSGIIPGTRNLSRAEVKKYLIELFRDNLIDRALILHLLTGGQRIAQLLRARVNDFDPLEGTLRLWDGKGKRQVPREHVIPLASLGLELCQALMTQALTLSAKLFANSGKTIANPSLFLSSSGATMFASTPGKRVADIVAALEIEPFDLRDIRRTVETMLAGLGISRDVRAQLLSHGLSGVQNQHYDRHQYMKEKRDALIIWEQHLEKILASEDGTNGSTKKQPLMTQ